MLVIVDHPIPFALKAVALRTPVVSTVLGIQNPIVAADRRTAHYAHFAQLGRVLVYAATRSKDALTVLEQIPELSGNNQLEPNNVGAWLSGDPSLKSIRNDPAFQAFAERYGD